MVWRPYIYGIPGLRISVHISVLDEAPNHHSSSEQTGGKPMIKKWNAVKIDAGKPVNEVFDLLMEALQKDHALKLCETVQMS